MQWKMKYKVLLGFHSYIIKCSYMHTTETQFTVVVFIQYNIIVGNAVIIVNVYNNKVPLS